jgi:hypothetical protein
MRPFTKRQEDEIRRIIADAIIGARIISPQDCTPQTQSAIRRAIINSGGK